MRGAKLTGVKLEVVCGVMACVCLVASLGCVMEEGGEEVPELDNSMSEEEVEGGIDGGIDGGDLSGGGVEEDEGSLEDMSSPEAEAFMLSGKLKGASRSGHVLVLWYVTSGESPQFYYHGSGAVEEDGRWSLQVEFEEGALPVGAMNADGVATALVLGVTAWERAAREEWGEVSWDEFRAIEARTFAVSKESALVYVRRGAIPDSRRSWAVEFVQGEVACGEALPEGEAGVEPVECESFPLEATRELAWIRF